MTQADKTPRGHEGEPIVETEDARAGSRTLLNARVLLFGLGLVILAFALVYLFT